MDIFGSIKSVVRELIEIGLVLIALAIVLSILVGGTLPFLGDVVGNLTTLVKNLGNNGLEKIGAETAALLPLPR